MNFVFVALFGFPLLLIVGVALLLIMGTNDLGELRKHPASLYLSFMTLTGVLLLLFATFLMAHGVTSDVAQVVIGAIAGACALGLLWFHVPKLSGTGGANIYAHLRYSVCATALLTGVVAVGATLFAVFAMAAPDTAGLGAFDDGVRSFVASGALAAMAGFVFWQAWHRPMERAPALELSE